MIIIVDKKKATKFVENEKTNFILAKDKRVILLQLLEKHKSFYDIVTEYHMDPAGIEQIVAGLLDIGDYDLRNSDEKKLYDYFRPDQVKDATVLSYYPIKKRITEAELLTMAEEELDDVMDIASLRAADTSTRHRVLKFRADLTREGIHVDNEKGRYSLYDSFKVTSDPALSSHNNSVIIIGG